MPAIPQPESPPKSPAARLLLGLLLVPGPSPVAGLVRVADSARAISDVLGGRLVDDTVIAAFDTGTAVTFYRADPASSPAAGSLPDNPAAAALAARVGLVDRQVQARLRGPILVLGLNGTRDASVPELLTSLACQTGLTVIDLTELEPAP